MFKRRRHLFGVAGEVRLLPSEPIPHGFELGVEPFKNVIESRE